MNNEQDEPWDFSERLAASLELRHLNQSELARKVGVSPQSVNKWLAGITRPRDDRIEEMARALFVSYRWLATGEGQMRHNEEIVKEEDKVYETLGFVESTFPVTRTSLEEKVISKLPDGAKDRVSQKIDPWNTGRKIDIDYVSPNLVAEFASLRPSRPSNEATQAKLWRLAVIARAFLRPWFNFI
ncbi:MAG: helix-turn-helix domain-containing protein [Xanthomonadales bacterium]|nr:helix-turn-helix domain-containing protein [Xanthomonadales bacterium]